jgi:hypothetical protein
VGNRRRPIVVSAQHRCSSHRRNSSACGPGEVAYYAPDTLAWLPLGQPYSGSVAWGLTGALWDFRVHLRWNGFQAEGAATPADALLDFHPPLFS